MSRPILTLLACVLACASACPMPSQARTLSAKIARVTTAVAVLEQVEVRLDWPARAQQGELRLRAARLDAPDLGYRFRDVDWSCALSRDGKGGWRCDGRLRSGNGPPLQLSLGLATASTDVRLAQGNARLDVHRHSAAPDDTVIDLTRVPMAWTQALLSQAWAGGQLRAGTLDGRLDVSTPSRGPLRVTGDLRLAGVALETPDATIAAENLGARLHVDYRRLQGDRLQGDKLRGDASNDTSLIAIEGELRGGELLFGTTYLALPRTPIAIRIDGLQRGSAGWQLPRVEWRDGNVLRAEGALAFAPDTTLQDLDVTLHSSDLSPVVARYLSGTLASTGLGDVTLAGAADARIRLVSGDLAAFDASLHDVTLDDAKARFRFDALDGGLRFSDGAAVDSQLGWRGGRLYGIELGAAELPLQGARGQLRLRQPVAIPALGGSLRFDRFELRPPAGERGMEMQFGLALQAMDVGVLARALDWPAFRGTLDGTIPNARYADDRLDFEGGLVMQVFDGEVSVSSLSMERPFGVAPTLSADIVIDDVDLLAVTEVFDFGSITGRLDGRIDDLRLVDWGATEFDAELHTDRDAPGKGQRQRISQRAVQNISSVGDASFVGSLQGRLIGLFDDFGYARIGISCRLANEVCEMGGLHSVAAGNAAGQGFTIVEGSGIPRLDVVGFNRQVDWPTLVERLAAVGKGDVKPVFE
jgi:hypothetical protein